VEEIIKFASEHGLMVSKEAMNLLNANKNWKKILEELASEGQLFIEPKNLEQKLARTKMSTSIKEKTINEPNFIAQAKHRAPNCHIMEEYDVTGKSNSEGTVDDFLRLFRSKFKLLSKMLKERHNLIPIEIKNLKTIAKNESVDLIGMVNKKWTTKNNHIAFEIEDMEAKCVVLIMEKETELMNKGERILEDNVVGIKGTKIGDDFLIIQDIFWPDLPLGKSRTIQDDVYIGVTSDLHLGSNCFMEEEFEKFIKYLNGIDVTPDQLEKVSKLQYLFIVGDIVSGVGVFPGQFEELVVKDLYDQYKKVEDYLVQIPDYIQVFICPGQHDAVRRAEPQPAISAEFMPRLHAKENFHFIASPSWVEVEGLKFLIYHGASIHDLISSVSFLEMDQPQEGMVELLKKRDLMPKYGGRNPYVPERQDYMVIKEVPDFVLIGDMHHNGYTTYRGTTIINGGCWESQTEFQKKIGHHPTPGVFPIISLKTRNITEIYFSRNNIQKNILANTVEEKE